jgi:hypothetical protein
MTSLLIIHVRSDAAGTWFVQAGEETMPVSAHPSETEAESAAIALADGVQGECHVVIHDRYARTHLAPDAEPDEAS